VKLTEIWVTVSQCYRISRSSWTPSTLI